MKYVVRSFEVQNITLDGNNYVSLKNSTITKLSKYYKSSIITNKNNVLQMKSDVLDPLHHRVSTDASSRYLKCPKGPESWCFFTACQVNARHLGLMNDISQNTYHTRSMRSQFTRDLLLRYAKDLTQNASIAVYGANTQKLGTLQIKAFKLQFQKPVQFWR